MTVEDTRMKKIVDLKSFILRVVGCGHALMLFELVELVEPVEALKLIPFRGFYISRVSIGRSINDLNDLDRLAIFRNNIMS